MRLIVIVDINGHFPPINDCEKFDVIIVNIPGVNTVEPIRVFVQINFDPKSCFIAKTRIWFLQSFNNLDPFPRQQIE